MKVLVAAAFGDAAIALLREKCSVDYLPKITQEELLRIIGDYDAIITRGTCPVRKEVISAGTRLRVIATAGVGTNHIDVDFANSKGIRVLNAAGANAHSVAELTVGLLLCLLRKIPAADSDIKGKGVYNKNLYLGQEAAEKTLGLVGIGQIGFKVAKICQAMEMKVLAYDPYIRPEIASEAKIELCSLAELFRDSDIVSVHVPLTEETKGMIDTVHLGFMKQGGYVINMSRGEIADEEAVAQALEKGQLAGYATDVICEEPAPGEVLPDSPLLRCKNIVMTPHMGAWTKEAQEKATVLTAKKLLEALEC